MKQHNILLILALLCVSMVSCSDKDEPDPLVYMMPSSIHSDDVNGSSQSFSYDSYGRVISWMQIFEDAKVTATFSYPDNNTIVVESKELIPEEERIYNEVITLEKGRAAKAEGTFVANFMDGVNIIRKTYRLNFEYDNVSDHLTEVKHSEVVGIGDNITDASWEKAWTWTNYLYWEDGNLKEFQDYHGHSSVQRTITYAYSNYAVFYPVVIPNVVGLCHHLPLFMQGIFGLNCNNFVSRTTTSDASGNITRTCDYSYKFENGYCSSFTETSCYGTVFSSPVTYDVTWTAE